MRYKHLKKANIDISELAVGTWAIGGDTWGDIDDKDSVEAIRAMIDHGVNLVDTAPCYGNGYSEEIVGRALADGYRNKVLISTKFGISIDGKFTKNGSYENCIRECDESLRRLKTDYIDIYIMHWPDPETPVEEGMRALSDLKKAGKIRFVGVSNFDIDLMKRAQQVVSIDMLQPPYSMINESQKDILCWCEEQGIGTMTYGSLGSGLLTGTIRKKPQYAANDSRNTFYGSFYTEPKFSKIMELLKELDVIADVHKKPMAQLAINWSTQKSYVSTAICGVRNAKEAAENCAAFDWKLTEEEMAVIDAKLKELNI